MIKIQRKDFNIELEINSIIKKNPSIGAVSTFIGYVRNLNNKKNVQSIEIEVYKNMAEKELKKICLAAKKKWDIQEYLILHRYGKLNTNEMEIGHHKIRKNSMVVITNPENNKSVTLKVSKKVKYPDFFIF